MSIRIVLAEDQRLVREALGALLAHQSDMVVVGEAATGPDAIELVLARRPDLLILDISLPGIDGIGVARELRSKFPEIRILALSVHSEKYFVSEMMKAGAVGYVDKSSALSELVRAIHLVMENRIYLSPEIAREALGGRFASETRAALSHREQQVLALLAQGKRSSEIAKSLHIAIGTVEVHRRNLMRKLELHSIAELTRYAIREGLIAP